MCTVWLYEVMKKNKAAVSENRTSMELKRIKLFHRFSPADCVVLNWSWCSALNGCKQNRALELEYLHNVGQRSQFPVPPFNVLAAFFIDTGIAPQCRTEKPVPCTAIQCVGSFFHCHRDSSTM